VCSLLLAAFASLAPGEVRAQKIADIIAPGATAYGSDFKFPDNKECQDCRKWWVYVKGDLENLKQYDTPEWRDWYDKNAAAADAAAKLKPLQDEVTKTAAAAKGKGKNSPEVAAATKAKTDAEKPAAAKAKADGELKKADENLKKSKANGTKDGLTELAKTLQENLAKLKACLEKCTPKDEKKKPDVTDGPNKGGGEEQPTEKEKKCFDTPAQKTAAIAKAQKRVEAAKAALRPFYHKQDSEGHTIPPDEDKDPDFKKALQEVNDANAELDEAQQAIVPCPKKSGSYVPGGGLPKGQYYASVIPGYRTGETVSYSRPTFATDSETYCTFGEGTGEPGYVSLTDGDGVDLPPSSYGGGTDGVPTGPGPQTVPGNPKTPPSDTPKETPTTAMTPQAPKEIPTPTASTPSPTPSPSETPVTTASNTPVPQSTPKQPTDTPTPQQPTDTPTPTTTDDNPPVHITIYIKATEEVLEGGQTGDPVESQVVKLVMKPERPTTNDGKRTADTNYDKPAPQCTIGKGGECRIELSEDDRALYALDKTPKIGGKPAMNYRLSINVMKHNGAVAEVTGKQVPDLKEVVTKGNMTAELVTIGGRSFLRIAYNIPKDVTDDFARKLSELLGGPVEIDICLIKEPGPPMGSEPVSYAAINQELPNASISVKSRVRRGAR
jgi:hypothetical protein